MSIILNAKATEATTTTIASQMPVRGGNAWAAIVVSPLTLFVTDCFVTLLGFFLWLWLLLR